MADLSITTDDPQTKEFLALYAKSERQILAYLIAVLGDRTDAEEVLQEAVLVMWRRFEDFESGTSFLAWARKIAAFRVMTFQKQKGRLGIPSNDAFLNSVEVVFAKNSDLMDARLKALGNCLEKLSASDRRLVENRYDSNTSIKELAVIEGRPANTLYKALERIRHALLGCIERAISKEGLL